MFEALVILILWQLCRFIKHIFKISTRDISDDDDDDDDDFINKVIYLYEEDDGDEDDD